jgi:ribosomal protein L11 methyltransferase
VLADCSPNGIEEIMKADGACELRAFFAEDAPVDQHEESLRSTFPSVQINKSVCEWDPHDESWRQHFIPYAIAPGIIIAPSWEQYRPKGDERVITLDPGMAFGTGLHPTTRMCAEAIYESLAFACHPSLRSGSLNRKLRDSSPSAQNDKPVGRNDIDKVSCQSLLDVGCGSGILMLVAKLSGYDDIVGVEVDEDAARVARENCELNGLPGAPVWNEVSQVKRKYDVVVANILLTTLLEICDDIARVSKNGGTLILSGITVDQVDEIKECYGRHFELKQVKEMEEWRCLIMTKSKFQMTNSKCKEPNDPNRGICFEH